MHPSQAMAAGRVRERRTWSAMPGIRFLGNGCNGCCVQRPLQDRTRACLLARRGQQVFHATSIAVRLAQTRTARSVTAGERHVTDGQSSSSLARQPSAEARTALDDLVGALDLSINELQDARERAAELRKQHDSGQDWTQIVTAETPPLIVERISTAMKTLAASGSRWRRAEALALHAEGLSINRIAVLFRVTRQRVSALIGGQTGQAGDDDVLKP